MYTVDNGKICLDYAVIKMAASDAISSAAAAAAISAFFVCRGFAPILGEHCSHPPHVVDIKLENYLWRSFRRIQKSD